MKHVLVCLALIIFSACTGDKSVLLPEINGSEITEITDVSPAYIFYDETKKDSVELNRKSLIISTNWLVNIDKRLTLKQALPSIVKLQEKNATQECIKMKPQEIFIRVMIPALKI